VITATRAAALVCLVATGCEADAPSAPTIDVKSRGQRVQPETSATSNEVAPAEPSCTASTRTLSVYLFRSSFAILSTISGSEVTVAPPVSSVATTNNHVGPGSPAVYALGAVSVVTSGSSTST